MFEDKQRNCTSTTTSIVVLDGSKVLREKGGVEPLRYALRLVMNPNDQVIVLVVFITGDLAQSPDITGCCIGHADVKNHRQPSDRERYIRKLREEISEGTEGYMKIFRPFYQEYKDIGVKFMVKIVVGSTLDAIIMEEKSNTGATSLVIGRHFARDNGSWSTQTNCKRSSNKDEEVALYICKPAYDVPESSRVQNIVNTAQINSKNKKKSLSHDEQKLIYFILPNVEGIYQPSSSSSSMESTFESSQEIEGFKKRLDPKSITPSSSSKELCLLIELSWEVISEITKRFSNIIPVDSNEPFKMYSGYLEDQSCAVFVKRYVGTDFGYVLEAEKKAASTMYHRNILGLLGFHKNETAMALVFPYSHSGGASMDRFLNGK
ncbi:uncharacterized protein [Rutidosis leptorrhynchoides]|uniref:uncharacterized protein n=1 Tax=Rutidosis leptorrhynchoides TaxID=125765 RepID=UPI003A9981D7